MGQLDINSDARTMHPKNSTRSKITWTNVDSQEQWISVEQLLPDVAASRPCSPRHARSMVAAPPIADAPSRDRRGRDGPNCDIEDARCGTKNEPPEGGSQFKPDDRVS